MLPVAALAAMLSGCAGLGVNPAPVDPVTTVAAGQITGTVFGGQQPVIGASIQLYTMNPTTLQGASSALLPTGAVTTDSGGGFNVNVSYTCPSGDYVYIVATGGDAGGGANTNLAMMAGVGACSAPYAYPKISINELTTVAAAYVLAPYMADYLHAGYAGGSISGLTGISNAFAMLNSLVNISTGTVPGASAPSNATMPVNQINTVADILAACVNSYTGGGSCYQLFFRALSSSGTQPGNTLDAAINIAHSPGQNVYYLYSLIATVPPYPTGTTSAPSEFSMPIKLTGGSLATPYGVAIDSTGNAWVTNETGTAVSEFSPIGAALGGSSGVTMNGAQGLTIDPAGHIWVANTGGNNLIELSPSGTYLQTVTSTLLSTPVDIAADARNNLWVANFSVVPGPGAFNLSEFDSTGAYQNGFTGGGSVSAPMVLAVDPQGNVWAANGTGVLTEYSKTFTQVSPNAGYTDNYLQGPAGIAFDATGNAWVTGQGAPELSGFTSAGGSVATAPVYPSSGGASLAQPTGVAVDGAGTIWVTNSTASGYLSEFTAGTGVPVTTAQALGSLNTPVQVAIDPSGNVWTANSGDSSVTIFLGLAAPTVTPLVARTQ